MEICTELTVEFVLTIVSIMGGIMGLGIIIIQWEWCKRNGKPQAWIWDGKT